MEKPKNKQSGHEDELGANDTKGARKVDSFKTGNKKQKLYFDQPFDEQMHDPDSLTAADDE